MDKNINSCRKVVKNLKMKKPRMIWISVNRQEIAIIMKEEKK